MSVDIKQYLSDGADFQARAVLNCIGFMGEIEESWDKQKEDYLAKLEGGKTEENRVMLFR